MRGIIYEGEVTHARESRLGDSFFDEGVRYDMDFRCERIYLDSERFDPVKIEQFRKAMREVYPDVRVLVEGK